MVKPPYRVPSMVEIASVPSNGYTVASTFSGAGGSSLGYRMAGFRVAWCNEFVPAARETYAANANGTVIDARDIRTVTADDVLRDLRMQVGQLDVLDGSPPCASFSTAGRREQSWGQRKTYSDTSQRTDDLFFEYVRLVRGIQPRVFVAENVSGLVKGVAKGYFKEILTELKSCGYQVTARLLDAQWLGVPQARQRIIFIGVRNDLGLDPVHPSPLPYRYSLRDALPELLNSRVVHDTSGNRSAGDVTDRPSPTITTGGLVSNACHYQVVHDTHNSSGNWSAGDVPDMPCPAVTSGSTGGNAGNYQVIAVGANAGFGTEEWQSPDVPVRAIGRNPDSGNGRCGAGEMLIRRDEQGISYDPETGTRISLTDGSPNSRTWDQLSVGQRAMHGNVRPDPRAPVATIRATNGNTVDRTGVMHPVERRKFTLGELRRVCGFPDDFVLTGTYAQRWERLGRAVPPPMMAAIATTVRDQILRRADG